jgi:3-dehydroquinate dehydratase-2
MSANYTGTRRKHLFLKFSDVFDVVAPEQVGKSLCECVNSEKIRKLVVKSYNFASIWRKNASGNPRRMAGFLLLNGPNLNLLGKREPEIYGHRTLEEIEDACTALAAKLGTKLVCYQSNAEHELVDRIQQAARESIRFIVFNPAAFTHTSVALRDVLLATGLPFIEVHLSNIQSREAFRTHSYFSDIAVGTIVGLGHTGYELAIRAAAHHVGQDPSDD